MPALIPKRKKEKIYFFRGEENQIREMEIQGERARSRKVNQALIRYRDKIRAPVRPQREDYNRAVKKSKTCWKRYGYARRRKLLHLLYQRIGHSRRRRNAPSISQAARKAGMNL